MTSIICILFCLFCSATYILNDVHDRKTDALHPEKKKRPIASGKLWIKTAIFLSLFLWIGSIVLSWFINLWCAMFFWIYLINTLLYTYFLKEKVIIDVFMISFGFLIRWAIGIAITDAIVSPWFLIMVFFGSLFLWFSKRYQESVLHSQNKISSRKNIHEYSEDFLKQILSVLTSFLLVAYTLYAFQSVQWSRMVWTIPIVTFGIIRFYYNIFFLWKNSISLENIILKDRPLIGSILLYCIVSIVLIYIIPNTISSL